MGCAMGKANKSLTMDRTMKETGMRTRSMDMALTSMPVALHTLVRRWEEIFVLFGIGRSSSDWMKLGI